MVNELPQLRQRRLVGRVWHVGWWAEPWTNICSSEDGGRGGLGKGALQVWTVIRPHLTPPSAWNHVKHVNVFKSAGEEIQRGVEKHQSAVTNCWLWPLVSIKRLRALNRWFVRTRISVLIIKSIDLSICLCSHTFFSTWSRHLLPAALVFNRCQQAIWPACFCYSGAASHSDFASTVIKVHDRHDVTTNSDVMCRYVSNGHMSSSLITILELSINCLRLTRKCSTAEC